MQSDEMRNELIFVHNIPFDVRKKEIEESRQKEKERKRDL